MLISKTLVFGGFHVKRKSKMSTRLDEEMTRANPTYSQRSLKVKREVLGVWQWKGNFSGPLLIL